MQIPSIPPPIVTNALSQDVVARAVPNVQAAQPILQNAVAATLKSEKSTDSRSNNDKGRGGKERDQREDDESPDDKRGQSVNISV
ncbi:MAG: hypothetical protein WCD70_10035 [Alphaproteobacteria bacterium]